MREGWSWNGGKLDEWMIGWIKESEINKHKNSAMKHVSLSPLGGDVSHEARQRGLYVRQTNK